jgi:hypothetical protein
MVHDECHPDVSLSDWDAFCTGVSPYLIEQVLDRGVQQVCHLGFCLWREEPRSPVHTCCADLDIVLVLLAHAVG